MGYEYKLDFEIADSEQADQVLRSVAGFEAFNPELQLYSFRHEATGAMPDADAKIEPSGIYVCAHGGSRRVIEDIQVAFSAVGLCAIPREL
jgi:hypothetical protein